MKKKTITTLATFITAAVILIGSYISQDDIGKAPEDNITQLENSYSNLVTTVFPETLVKTEEEGIVPFGYIDATVTQVTDGDTLRISYKNQEYKVRLLDIDTPESVKSGVEKQPYSDKAADLTKQILTGKEVKLIFEKDTTDQYDRLLAHIVLKDGVYYNALMVQNGYAICVFYSPNTLLKDYFSELQDEAIEDKNGFWQLPEAERPFIKDSKGNFVASYKKVKKAA